MFVRLIHNHFITSLRMYIKDTLLNSVSSCYWCPCKLRNLIYSIYGHKISGGIKAGAFLGYGNGQLQIGRNSSVNYKAFFDLGDDIIIQENCEISFNVTFINSSHRIGGGLHRAGNGTHQPIVVCNGCWIGANVIIMPGVTIGDGCVIGAGTLVTKDCEPNGLYVGVPAKRIKELI